MNNNEEMFYREIFNKTNEINKSLKKIFDKEELKRFSSLIWENIKNEFENCNKNLNDLIIRMRFELLIVYFISICKEKDFEEFKDLCIFNKNISEYKLHYTEPINIIKEYICKNGSIKF